MINDAAHSNPNIENRLQAIYDLHFKTMDFRLGQGPYGDLLQALGHPHRNLPPVIHIAGTNGKGSTLAFLRSLLQAQGLRVHAYTSPHLIKFNERISLSGANITDDELLYYLDMIDLANDGAPVTFFEYTTALAFKAFADHPADICLLETGLGGRLDCTNVVEKPAACVITAIGYDHMDWLGDEIETIAGEKAGIMKPGVPCFIAPQNYDIAHVFERHAAQVGCDVHIVKRCDDLPQLGLVGDHQKDNASTALAVINHLLPGRKDGEADIKALSNVKWPARMEHLSAAADIWFDCGHNIDGARAIAAQLKTWKMAEPDRPVHIILGLAKDKNPNDFMDALWPHIDGLSCVDLLNARNPQSAQDLAGKINSPAHRIQWFKTPKEAVEEVHAKHPNTRILVTGSLYLYEQVTTMINQEIE